MGPLDNAVQSPYLRSLISYLNFPLLCNLICSKVLEIKMWTSLRVISLPCCSVAKSCLTPCSPMNCSTPGFLVFHYLPEFALPQHHCLFILIFTVSQICPVGAPVTFCIVCCISVLEYYFVFWCNKVLQTHLELSYSSLESSCVSKEPWFLLLKMIVWSQGLGCSCVHVVEVSLFLVPLYVQTYFVCLYAHTYVCICLLLT